ncbi:MAG: ABC transporter permease [Candidatus Eisenbacteria bacterium]|uniref:ABC transporter permease n=1 Tax=Eiseniibacteriota bacterium TaxID=2212470 RepID=A0A7Y2E8K7_UNCEI|nr:ABC transporter permease [Candidatus Eisenbacteria bacterium]
MAAEPVLPLVEEPGTNRVKSAMVQNIVPILFGLLCLTGVLAAQIPFPFLINEVVTRLARNLFLVLSLIIPVVAGMGLNFGIVIGAMCGQISLIIVENAEWAGIDALLIAALISLPLSLLFGFLTGLLMNQAKGREMITGMILAFFANGIYQLLFLLMAGPLIPLRNEKILLPTGVGLRNTIDLVGTKHQLDELVRVGVPFMGLKLFFPIITFVVIALLCFGLRWYLNTRSGHGLRAVGQDMHVAEIAGIHVNRSRIRAIILSTMLGGIGHVIWLHSIGTMNTYQSHEQVGPYAIAALLVGGATVARATIWHAILGTFLFHTLFIVSPLAGQTLLGSAQIGEYFREFVSYAVIGVTLALHAWKTARA